MVKLLFEWKETEQGQRVDYGKIHKLVTTETSHVTSSKSSVQLSVKYCKLVHLPTGSRWVLLDERASISEPKFIEYSKGSLDSTQQQQREELTANQLAKT